MPVVGGIMMFIERQLSRIDAKAKLKKITNILAYTSLRWTRIACVSSHPIGLGDMFPCDLCNNDFAFSGFGEAVAVWTFCLWSPALELEGTLASVVDTDQWSFQAYEINKRSSFLPRGVRADIVQVYSLLPFFSQEWGELVWANPSPSVFHLRN